MTSNETILDVDGMSCSSCVRHVTAALRGLQGIDKVDVSLEEGKVRVEHEPSGPTLDEMIRALDDAGYESRAAAFSK